MQLKGVPITSLEQPGSVFTEDELAYLHGERRLARIATVGEDGTPAAPKRSRSRRR